MDWLITMIAVVTLIAVGIAIDDDALSMSLMMTGFIWFWLKVYG